MPRLLADAEVEKRLEALDGWAHRGKFITKTFEFPTFMDGIRFIGSVADVAEAQEHHPDIKVVYTKVVLSIQTHSEGGVTEWDIALAKAIDERFTEL